ncbi:MAG: ketoacyl-ACP synthase III [Moraxellaceae bacterium]|nr:ketoacyl-ACP synthase III [Moraxellaceae bacterium]
MPSSSREITEYVDQFGAGAVKKISISTGISALRVAADDICTSDLCYAAACSLMEQSGIAADSIDTLIFVTQTPDYVLPATSCVLQGRLGLSKSCAAFDINLGCSGYVYGLWMAAGLVASGQSKNVLLLVGDTISKIVSEEDRSVAMLFGDAGSASLVTVGSDTDEMSFNLGTDGTGWESIVVRDGGFRNRTSGASLVRTDVDGGRRSPMELAMRGSEVFEFTQSQVPESIEQLMTYANSSVEDIDHFVPHQANKFMLSHLSGKLGFAREKLVIGIGRNGNTSSASIPLAIVTELQEKERLGKVLLSGFGVGLSWGSLLMRCDNLKILPLVEI